MNTPTPNAQNPIFCKPLSDPASGLSPWKVLEALEAFGRELFESPQGGSPNYRLVSSSLKVKQWPEASQTVFLEAWFVPGGARRTELRMRVFAQGPRRDRSLVKVVYSLRRSG